MENNGGKHLWALAVAAAVAVTGARADYDAMQDPTAEKGLGSTVVWRSGEEGIAYYRCPALVTAPNGDLVAAVDVRKEGINDLHYGMPMWVAVKRSSDNGRTWTKCEKVWDWPWTDAEKRSATDPSLVVDSETGKIFLFYTGCEFTKGNAPNEFFVQESSDNGRTWSKPRELTKEIAIPDWPFGEDNSKVKANIFIPSGSGAQLKDGTLVHTITCSTLAQVALLASRDHGKSWSIMGRPVKGGNECKVVELRSGALMINSRWSNSCRYVLVTPDRGLTWKARWDAQLVDPQCNGQVIRAGGRILCSHCNSIYRRNLCVRASADDGQTWTDGLCVAPGGAAYSDMTVLKNGDLGVMWEGENYGTVEFATVPMAEVLGDGTPLVEAVKKDYAAPVRPIGVNGQVEWNVRSDFFKYPPTFAFTNEPSAAWYRFTVTNETGFMTRFFGKTPNDSFAPVWPKVPVGWTTVTCEAADAKRTPFKTVGARTFWRDAGFRPGAYPKATRSYAETARLVRRYLMKMPIARMLYLGGKGVPKEAVTVENQVFVAYPCKMGAATINAMTRLAKSDPGSAKEALELAKGAFRHLQSVTEPEGSPLAGFPRTYAAHPGLTANPKKMTEQNGGKVMMVYPGEASDAYLDLYALTKDETYKAAAVRVMDRYLALQGEDGTWPLNCWLKDGTAVEANRLVPVHVAESFEKIYAVTGEAKYRAAADRALVYIDLGPLVTWNWEGQFEDTKPKGPYLDLTGHNATELVLYLMNRHPADAKRRAQARELIRFCEDQFVIWTAPDNERFYARKKDVRFMLWGLDTWKAPSVIEQYDCALPVDASVARMVRAYLALGRVEGNPLDLAKAKVLGDSLVRQTRDDGYCKSFWSDLISEDWPDCLMDDALALDELALAR